MHHRRMRGAAAWVAGVAFLITSAATLAAAPRDHGTGSRVPEKTKVRVVTQVVRREELVTKPAGEWLWHEAVVTAYTLSPSETGKRPGDPGWGVTASGLRVRPGTAAVDPRVIPLGTVLWIPGYGPAVATDTGGGVKGWHVDIWMEDRASAMRWGRRRLLVGLLLRNAFETAAEAGGHNGT